MKQLRSFVLFLCAIVAFGCSAQYYEAANQLTSILSPMLSGSANYRGFVDVTGTVGVGPDRVGFAGISTTQGFQYNNWFFMGAGLGIDVAHSANYEGMDGGSMKTVGTQAMLPIFSDFRFNIGTGTSAGVFIDLKLGAAWFLGDGHLSAGNVQMGHGAQFLMRPSVGMRFPISANSKQAFNVGVTYQLITSGNNYTWNGKSVTLSSIGASLSFEW